MFHFTSTVQYLLCCRCSFSCCYLRWFSNLKAQQGSTKLVPKALGDLLILFCQENCFFVGRNYCCCNLLFLFDFVLHCSYSMHNIGTVLSLSLILILILVFGSCCIEATTWSGNCILVNNHNVCHPIL